MTENSQTPDLTITPKAQSQVAKVRVIEGMFSTQPMVAQMLGTISFEETPQNFIERCTKMQQAGT
jgi:hypothetical protein